MFRGPANFHGCQTCIVISSYLRRPCCCQSQSQFRCPYCSCPFFHLHDVPSTSGRFYGYNNYGNSSPDQYRIRRSSSDISLHSFYNEGLNEVEATVGDNKGLPE
ncbi:unnamed protein product [Arabidopsis halleri]